MGVLGEIKGWMEMSARALAISLNQKGPEQGPFLLP